MDVSLIVPAKKFDNYLFRLVATTPAYACGDSAISDYSRIVLREIFIPDGFSPDGDGVNDTWHITGIDRYEGNHIEVYNRWEVKVYEADNYQIVTPEWDGTVNVNTLLLGSGQLPEGTYFFIIDLGEGKAARKPIKGYVYIRKTNR